MTPSRLQLALILGLFTTFTSTLAAETTGPSSLIKNNNSAANQRYIVELRSNLHPFIHHDAFSEDIRIKENQFLSQASDLIVPSTVVSSGTGLLSVHANPNDLNLITNLPMVASISTDVGGEERSGLAALPQTRSIRDELQYKGTASIRIFVSDIDNPWAGSQPHAGQISNFYRDAHNLVDGSNTRLINKQIRLGMESIDLEVTPEGFDWIAEQPSIIGIKNLSSTAETTSQHHSLNERNPGLANSFRSRVTSTNNLRVLISLPTGLESEGDFFLSRLPNQTHSILASNLNETKNEINTVANGTGNGFSFSHPATTGTEYTNLPVIAATLTPNNIDEVLASDILSIEEVFFVSAQLSSSTNIINLPPVWDAGYRGDGQIIVIIDHGIDKHHAFLNGRIMMEACFSTPGQGNTCPNPNASGDSFGPGSGMPCTASGCGHGTQMAGIASGGPLTVNGKTLSGVAPNARLVSIKASTIANTPAGNIPVFSSEDLLAALNAVLNHPNRASVAAVNMSLGSGRFESFCDNFYQPYPADHSSFAITGAINSLYAQNIGIVAASGNNSFADAINWPSCIRNAVSVSALLNKLPFEIWPRSNSAGIIDGIPMLDFLAPGAPIQTSTPPSGYSFLSGTSNAAPHVSGALALMKQRFPSTTLGWRIQALKSYSMSYIDPRNGVATPVLMSPFKRPEGIPPIHTP